MTTPPPPALTLAFEANIALAAPLTVGVTPDGARRVVPIVGGEFEGPAIRGTVLGGGADWQYDRGDSVTILSAQYLLKSEDGALIQVRNHALRHGPAPVMRQLAAGEAVAAHEYYFRGSPRFAAPAGKHDWLNRYIFLCTGYRHANAVRLLFYRVD